MKLKTLQLNKDRDTDILRRLETLRVKRAKSFRMAKLTGLDVLRQVVEEASLKEVNLQCAFNKGYEMGSRKAAQATN